VALLTSAPRVEKGWWGPSGDMCANCRGGFSRALVSPEVGSGPLGESGWSSRPLSLSIIYYYYFLQVSNIPAPP
jgi:hypothetical protein